MLASSITIWIQDFKLLVTIIGHHTLENKPDHEVLPPGDRGNNERGQGSFKKQYKSIIDVLYKDVGQNTAQQAGSK